MCNDDSEISGLAPHTTFPWLFDTLYSGAIISGQGNGADASWFGASYEQRSHFGPEGWVLSDNLPIFLLLLSKSHRHLHGVNNLIFNFFFGVSNLNFSFSGNNCDNNNVITITAKENTVRKSQGFLGILRSPGHGTKCYKAWTSFQPTSFKFWFGIFKPNDFG